MYNACDKECHIATHVRCCQSEKERRTDTKYTRKKTDKLWIFQCTLSSPFAVENQPITTSLFYKGILQDFLLEVRTNQIRISSRVLLLLNQLHDKAALVASKAQPFLNASDPDYYRLGFVARHAWPFKREFRNLDTSLSRIYFQGSGNVESDMRTMEFDWRPEVWCEAL